jgi:hypothetical protein
MRRHKDALHIQPEATIGIDCHTGGEDADDV